MSYFQVVYISHLYQKSTKIMSIFTHFRFQLIFFQASTSYYIQYTISKIVKNKTKYSTCHIAIDELSMMIPNAANSAPTTRVALLPAQSDRGPPNRAPIRDPSEKRDTTRP